MKIKVDLDQIQHEYMDDEDFINTMINVSDYSIDSIVEFAKEHFQNHLSFEVNVDNFIKWNYETH